jgi:hypothetical protein
MFMKAFIKEWLRFIPHVLPRPLKQAHRFGFVPGVKSLGTGDSYKGEVVEGAKLIYAPWVAERRLPNRLRGSLPDAFYREERHALPGAAAAILPRGRVLGREGVVFDRNGFLIAEPARQFSTPFDWRELYSIVRPKPSYIKGRWGVLTGCGGIGYFHWMLDILPRVVLMREISPNLDGWIVGGLTQPFVRQSLDLIGIPMDICREVRPIDHFVVDELVVASCPSVPGNPPRWAVDFLRQLTAGAISATSSLPNRFLVSRRKVATRSIKNEAELTARLAKYQFEPVVLEALSLVDQIRLFANAEMIVSPHGAGLTNLAFASSNARVIEIFGDDYINVCFWALADILNLNYSCLVAESSKKQIMSANSGGIEMSEIDINIIEKWVPSVSK